MWKLNRRSVSLVETATMNQATLPRDRGTVFLVVLLPVTVSNPHRHFDSAS